MKSRKDKKPFPWLSNFNEKKFEPFIRAIGQSTLLWNDLHEWMGHLYCIAMGGGVINQHLRVWNSLTSDRAKREMLLAAATYAFKEDRGRHQTPLDKRSFEALDYLCRESKKLEEDRNNVVHAPLWKSQSDGEIYPSSAFGNKRAQNLDDKYLRKEYERIRETSRLLRNYAAEIHDPMCDSHLSWPDTPKLPDRKGSKRPPPPPPEGLQ
jgi:hypothetical protein